jgi:hypothetical protein
MVSQLNSNTTAREAGYEMMQYIAGRITTLAAGTAVTSKIGTLPIGAVIQGVNHRVVTAYATAAAMGVTVGGSGTTPNNIASGLNTIAASFVQALTNVTQPLTADLDVWAQITSGASAGDSMISVWFTKPNV